MPNSLNFGYTMHLMWLYSIGHHTLHGIITHTRMLFIARGRRPSAIIESEDEESSHVEYGDLWNKATLLHSAYPIM